MRRRKFIAGLSSAAAVWPQIARAQQPPSRVIGFLHPSAAKTYASLMPAFRKGLDEVGYVEGRNLIIEYRWAEDHYDRLPSLAAELVSRQVSVSSQVTQPPPLSPPKLPLQPFRSYSQSAPIRCSLDWSPASTILAGMSPA
jgi:putative tryptophan/tyrosine transport system substrate-binding protein